MCLAFGACTDDDPVGASSGMECEVGEREECIGSAGLGARWCDTRGTFGPCTAVTRDAGSGRPDEDVSIEAPTRSTQAVCSGTSLAFRPQDVEYAGALDRIVAVSATPNQLILLDPQSGATRTVALPLEPVAVSVAPDGRTAAVAHDAFVSIVDLAAATLTATIPTTTDASDVVLAGDGFAYVFPETDQWVEVHVVDIAGRVELPTSNRHAIYERLHARLHPSGTAIYSVERSLTPVDIERLDVKGGVVSDAHDSPYHGDYPMCENLWFTESGDRVFNACGTVFRATPGGSDDLVYAGRLASSGDRSTPLYAWVVHSGVRKQVYALTAPSRSRTGAAPASHALPSRIDVHGEDFLQREQSLDVPCLQTKVGKQAVQGRYVFVDPTGARLYVLGQLSPEAGAALDWVSAVITL